MEQPPVTKEEILAIFTQIMREGTGPAALRAAELIGRYYNLFEETATSEPPQIIDEGYLPS